MQEHEDVADGQDSHAVDFPSSSTASDSPYYAVVESRVDSPRDRSGQHLDVDS